MSWHRFPIVAGRAGGRPTVKDSECLKAACDLLPRWSSVTSIARLLSVSVDILCNRIPDLQELRAAGAEAAALTQGTTR
jgi:hypothetical protein